MNRMLEKDHPEEKGTAMKNTVDAVAQPLYSRIRK
jgi:hypothetical protein